MTQSTITGSWQGRREGDEPGGRIDSLTLDRRLGERTWLGHSGGEPVAALRLCATGDPPTQDVAQVISRAGALASVSSSFVIPVLGAAWVEGAIWIVSEWDTGTSLLRLKQVTWLTPAQAVVIATGVLSALRDINAAGYACRSLYASDIRIDSDGRVRLTGWAAENMLDGQSAQSSRQTATSAAELLAGLAAVARRSVPSATELISALYTASEKLAAPNADAEDITTVAAELANTVDGVRLLQTRAELSALTQAARGPTPRTTPAPPRRQRLIPPGTTRLRASLRRSRRSMVRWLIALVILAGALGLTQVFLHDRITHNLRELIGHSGTKHPSTAASHAPGTAPAPVAALAPAHAGAVTAVRVRAMQPCKARSACQVRVLVQLRPHTKPVAVNWSFTIVDRCARSQHALKGGAVRAAANATQIDAVSTVRLPKGRALAVVAVTHAPARAASGPLLVPARGGRC